MPADTKKKAIRDSFLDALQSEMLAGTENLASWIKHIEASGGLEDLFELETWLKGLRSFFDVQHLPMSDSERRNLVDRSFGPEIRIARHALQICEASAGQLIKHGRTDKVEFESFIENQLRKDNVLDYHISKIVEQPTPLDSLIQLSESLNDLRVMVDAVKDAERLDYQLFLSLGRSYRRALRNCRYIEMLLAQRFRVQYDRIDNAALGSALRGIEDEQTRHDVALALLWLFRLLRYLQRVERDLSESRSLRHSLVIFCLLHSEMEQLTEYTRLHFLKKADVAPHLKSAAELIVFSLKMESQRALERELLLAARESDPSALYSKIENSQGMLRNCYQSCVVTLAQVFDRSFDGKATFPSMMESLQKAQRLRQDLWDLRQYLKDILQNRSALDVNSVVEKVAAFRESSLHFLMYRDWGEFEKLSDSLITATIPLEVRTFLRKFVSFLETLMEEVSKRSVLKESAGDGASTP
ncbi:MAG TPA: hypothetical protein VE398_03515 [Acidobacteriota bacterium]|nr:hypothetical protein [Acidobacteriota bacterium]